MTKTPISSKLPFEHQLPLYSPCMEHYVFEAVKEYLSGYDASHDHWHISRVLSNAKKLTQMELPTNPTLNVQIITLAALLHDVGDYKLTKDHSLQLPHIHQVLHKAQTKAKEHGISPLPTEHIEFICQIICNMSFRKELETAEGAAQSVLNSVEFKIVQDADRLDALGAIGLARCFAYTGAVGRAIVVGDGDFRRYEAAAASLSAESYNDAVINSDAAKKNSCPYVHDAVAHLFEKILKLRDLMKTSSGRQLAEQRHTFVQAFLQQLSQELGTEGQ